MQAQLIPVDGGKPITLKRDVTLVGRKPGLCDLIVDRGSISKLHCLIVKTDGLLFIRDLGSTNGTKVNGQRVIRGALLPGDELAFASAKYRVHLGPGDSEVEPEELTEELTHLPAEVESAVGDFDDQGSLSDVRLLSEDEDSVA
jgi:pSer/pThr/pTyr-binding forkhead associated (FHA) protein